MMGWHWFLMVLAFVFAGITAWRSMNELFLGIASHLPGGVSLARTRTSNPHPKHGWRFKLAMIVICQGVACLFVWIITILPRPVTALPALMNLTDFATLFAACFGAIFSYPAFLLDSDQSRND